MKLRRLLLAGIVLGGILLVALGIAGVFSPDRPTTPASSTEAGSRGASDILDDDDVEPGQPVFEDFRVEGESWVLTGTRAQIGEGGQIQLVDPELRGTRQTSEGPERINVHAKQGLYISGKLDSEDAVLDEKLDRRVEMTGSVVVEFAGREEARLETETIVILHDAGIVRSDDRVSIRATSPDGRQFVSGVGLEMVRDQRMARLFRDVHMELSGASPILPTGSPSGESPGADDLTYIDCRGPVVIDGFKRSFLVEDDVKLKQGQTRLDARRVEVFFAPKGRDVDRVRAEGDVRFSGPDVTGNCESLLHIAGEEQVLFEGRPAVLSQGPNAINANRIEMDLADGRVFVPVPGQVKFSIPAEEDSAPADVAVKWSTSMSFDDVRGEAICRGDVLFSYDSGAVEMQSDRLNVRFDKESRQLKECRGEGNCRLRGRIESFAVAGGEDASAEGGPVTASSREMTYDPAAESLVLVGDARLKQGPQSLSGDRVAVRVRDGAVHVTGAGRLSVEATEAGAEGGLEATWTGEMQFARNTGEAEFDRDVTLQYGNMGLVSDRLVAQIAGGNRLQQLHATGNVTLTEAGAAEDAAGRVLQSHELTVRPREGDAALQEVEARGNVVVTELVADKNASRTLRADRVTSEIAADRSMTHFNALGHVLFEQDGSQGWGDRFVWDVATESGVLTGAPVTLKSGRSRLNGDRIDFDQKRGRVRITSKTRVNAAIVTSAESKDVLGGWFQPSRNE